MTEFGNSGQTAAVINLSDYFETRQTATAPAAAVQTYGTAPEEVSARWRRNEDSSERTSILDAKVLERVDPEADLSQFIRLARDGADVLQECIDLLRNEDTLGADERLLAAKKIFAEMLMFRALNDSAGLLSLRCFQASSMLAVVTDAPELVRAMHKAVRRVRAAPFLKFEEACVLADEIERAAPGLLTTAGYAELSNELISAAET